MNRGTKLGHKIDRQLGVLFDYTDEYKMCMLDIEGRIIGWSVSAERMTGFQAKDVLGKEYSIFISKEEKRQKLFKKVLAIAEREGSYTAEGIMVRKDGSHFWARALITPMKELDGSTRFFVVITKNISKEKQLEQKREEYIGIASHELKNPITTLSLYSELLAQRLQLDSDKRNLHRNLHMLRDIQDQAARLVTLVDDLLIVSKVDGGTFELHRELFNVNEFLKKIVVDFQSVTKTHKLVTVGSVEHLVRGDRDRIAQVLINLLANAVKYSPQSNKVMVRIERVQNKCVVSVQDFGQGISKMDQRDIFTRFFRASDAEAGNVAGVGLGLYIAKEIIKRHGQRLWVKSAVGQGTTFSFTLSLS